MLLGHVFPIAARHILELFAGIHAFLDADGLKVRSPEILEELVVAAEDISIEFAIRKTEGYGRLVLEGDADDLLTVIIEAIMALGIVDEPRLVVETIAEMVGNQGQNIMVGRDNGEVCAVLCFLETDKLLHAQLLMEHTTGDIGYRQHILVSEIVGDIALAEHLIDILKQW